MCKVLSKKGVGVVYGAGFVVCLLYNGNTGIFKYKQTDFHYCKDILIISFLGAKVKKKVDFCNIF
ncbi:hypothetical protein AA637_07995 [Cyanobacterium sp. HL-69]|nr:hypothetical protein AA637_07995 [Cyanobacterium sp. HL-69]